MRQAAGGGGLQHSPLRAVRASDVRLEQALLLGVCARPRVYFLHTQSKFCLALELRRVCTGVVQLSPYCGFCVLPGGSGVRLRMYTSARISRDPNVCD